MPDPSRPAAASCRIDLHVHTSRYSACAESVDAYRLADTARDAGLDGVVLTDHDVLWAEEEIEVLRGASPGFLIFRGIEVSARDAHLVVIGLDDAASLHRGAASQEIIERAHSIGAAVILAHPYRDAEPSEVPLHLLDGVEVASTSFSKPEAVRSLTLARMSRVPPVAASDAHALSRVGWAWTEFPQRPRDEHSLAEMLIAGAGRPAIPRWPDVERRARQS